MNTANAAAKKKPNLSTVTPITAPPVLAPPPDTTTPMDTSVLAFSQIYLPQWTPFMTARMAEHWPHITAYNCPGLMVGFMQDNSSIFIRAKKAILLANWHREALEPRPVVNIVFCFKFDPDDDEQDKDVRLLFRRVDEWAKNIGARFIKIQKPEAVDLTPSRLKEVLWGEEEKVWTKDLDK